MSVDRIGSGVIARQVILATRDGSKRREAVSGRSDVSGAEKRRTEQNKTEDLVKERENEKASVPSSLERILRRDLQLEVEEELHMVVAKIVDPESGEVVRQIPPEEMVRIYKRLKEMMPELRVECKVKKEA